MPNWKPWKKNTPAEQVSALPGRTATAGEPIIPATAPRENAPASPDRVATLKRRRDGILFDVEQSELAQQPENPWRERIELLNQTIDDIRRERQGLDSLPKVERPIPTNQPVSIDRVTANDPATVSYSIAAEPFLFESEVDWAERGTTISRNELELRTGDASIFASPDWSESDRADFATRLNESLFIFASDLRNRAENGEAFPSELTLSDLISTCPVCGDWQLWGGLCPACAERDRQRKSLDSEISARLLEINAEEEERAKLADRLPIALRRLADVQAELKALGIDD
ncbi:hypothetical protein BH09CHL1_BH09CHL1_33530 [soil metagenome]